MSTIHVHEWATNKRMPRIRSFVILFVDGICPNSTHWS
jgi:hypothetical protein